mgnify:CR=1 FL=1
MQWARLHGSSNNLVFTGGSALNCVANSRIANMWDDIWIMPSPGDAGSAIGAILADMNTHIRWPGAYLGHDIHGKYPTDSVVHQLLKKKICGVASGKAEFGPRALGNRSILTSPFPASMKDYLNSRVKFREEFRPFAPSILSEYAKDYFSINQESPHMLIAANVKEDKTSEIPAVVHVDNTARIQTVTNENNSIFRKWYC